MTFSHDHFITIVFYCQSCTRLDLYLFWYSVVVSLHPYTYSNDTQKNDSPLPTTVDTPCMAYSSENLNRKGRHQTNNLTTIRHKSTCMDVTKSRTNWMGKGMMMLMMMKWKLGEDLFVIYCLFIHTFNMVEWNKI